ncbi:MAG: DUF402 domain-containing protein [Chitinivibrionales bacterium]|nr:DUF402 domain-containing protein [Chitinivibrionales bacterium]
MSPEIVVIRKVRRAENICRWPAYVMSEDSHGLWLYSPTGTIHRCRAGSEIRECKVGGGPDGPGFHVMHLVPCAAWWTAAWHYGRREDEVSISVDICTPPRLIDDEWCYTDLKLDPYAFPDGRVVVDDEEEFAAACETGLISPNEALEARAAATEVEGHLRDRSEPFGLVGWNKLDEAMGQSLPPIEELRDES